MCRIYLLRQEKETDMTDETNKMNTLIAACWKDLGKKENKRRPISSAPPLSVSESSLSSLTRLRPRT